jgi:hypothetical protein
MSENLKFFSIIQDNLSFEVTIFNKIVGFFKKGLCVLSLQKNEFGRLCGYIMSTTLNLFKDFFETDDIVTGTKFEIKFMATYGMVAEFQINYQDYGEFSFKGGSTPGVPFMN